MIRGQLDLIDQHWSHSGFGLVRFPTTRLFMNHDSHDHLSIIDSATRDINTAVLVDATVEKSGFCRELRETVLREGLWISTSGEPQVEALQMLRDAVGRDIDAIVGLGGGSTIDAAKFIRESLRDGPRDSDPLLLVVPTLPGSGTEVSRNVVYSNSMGQKNALRSYRLSPDVAVMHVRAARDCPNALLVLGAFDAFCHILESSTLRHEGHPALASQRDFGFQAIQAGLDALQSNRNFAVSQLQMASVIGGDHISNSRTGLIHALGEALSSLHPGLPHPATLAVFASELLDRYATLLHPQFNLGQSEHHATRLSFEYWQQQFHASGASEIVSRVRQALELTPTPSILLRLEADVVLAKEEPLGLTRHNIVDIIESSREQL